MRGPLNRGPPKNPNETLTWDHCSAVAFQGPVVWLLVLRLSPSGMVSQTDGARIPAKICPSCVNLHPSALLACAHRWSMFLAAPWSPHEENEIVGRLQLPCVTDGTLLTTAPRHSPNNACIEEAIIATLLGKHRLPNVCTGTTAISEMPCIFWFNNMYNSIACMCTTRKLFLVINSSCQKKQEKTQWLRKASWRNQ